MRISLIPLKLHQSQLHSLSNGPTKLGFTIGTKVSLLWEMISVFHFDGLLWKFVVDIDRLVYGIEHVTCCTINLSSVLEISELAIFNNVKVDVRMKRKTNNFREFYHNRVL